MSNSEIKWIGWGGALVFAVLLLTGHKWACWVVGIPLLAFCGAVIVKSGLQSFDE